MHSQPTGQLILPDSIPLAQHCTTRHTSTWLPVLHLVNLADRDSKLVPISAWPWFTLSVVSYFLVQHKEHTKWSLRKPLHAQKDSRSFLLSHLQVLIHILIQYFTLGKIFKWINKRVGKLQSRKPWEDREKMIGSEHHLFLIVWLLVGYPQCTIRQRQLKKQLIDTSAL